MLTPQEQFKKFLEDSKEPLILLPQEVSADSVCAAWGLYFFLEKIGLRPTIASSEKPERTFGFLKKPGRVLSDISGARDFVLSFDTARNKIQGVRSQQSGDRFEIFVTPEKGSIDPRDFSFILARFKYDLVITVGSSDLESLGGLYEKNPDLFFEVPIINIDRRSENENFGQINLVDVTASSCSEIVSSLLEEMESEMIDEDISKALLTGIISATDRFQRKNTTPRSFIQAAKLMDRGADQQEIVRWLYKTHPLGILKLWGRAMAKINYVQELRMIWSALSVEDFVQSRSDQESLPLILDKLQENYSEGRLFMIIRNDTQHSSIALIRASEEKVLQEISASLGGNLRAGTLEIRVDIGDLAQAGKMIEDKLLGSVSS